MPSRLTILDQIESDIKNKIKASRGYNFTPVEVKRGMHKWNDFVLKPVLCFTMYRDEPDEDSEAGTLARWLYFYGYGYHDTDGIGNTDRIQNLAQDFEDFLFSSDFTYTDQTEVGEIEIKEGGVSDQINSFIIQFRVLYEV